MSSFAALHDRNNPLILPNAWDVASARIFEAVGFRAVATTSAGLAWSLGYADGEAVDVDEMLAAIARIARGVRCFLSVDLEAGFASDPAAVVALAERVFQAGACGINLEDWDVRSDAPYEFELAANRIGALKRRFGERLFVNARTDILLHAFGDSALRLDETIARLRAFAAAGADGVFVPGVEDEQTIALLAGATPLPLNVLARGSMPPVARLRELGVARVSVGSGPMLRALGETQAVARELLNAGTYSYLQSSDMMRYDDANALFEARV